MLLFYVNLKIIHIFEPLTNVEIMKKITLLMLVATLFSQLVNAQMAQPGILTVRSEEGLKFYLELNGERYNEKPLSIVRIEDLMDDDYDCTIIFENNSKSQIRKTVMITDDKRKAQDVTYIIKKNKKGRRGITRHTAVPVNYNAPRPENCVTYCYGNPYHIIAGPGAFPLPAIPQPGVVPYPGNYPGYPAGNNGGAVVTTTTTTTTTTTGGGNYGYPNPTGNYPGQNGYPVYGEPVYDGSAPCRYAMPAADFEQAKATVKDNSFDDTKLSTAQEVISTNCLSSAQILDLIKLFAFEETRLKVAKFAYGYCIDPNNYFKVSNAFKFEHSKQELNEYIRSQRQ